MTPELSRKELIAYVLRARGEAPKAMVEPDVAPLLGRKSRAFYFFLPWLVTTAQYLLLPLAPLGWGNWYGRVSITAMVLQLFAGLAAPLVTIIFRLGAPWQRAATCYAWGSFWVFAVVGLVVVPVWLLLWL